MSFEQLKQAIESAAVAEVQGIQAEGLAQRRREEGRIKQRARQLEERIIDAAEAQAARGAKQLHQEYQLDAKANILIAKQAELARLEVALAEHVLAQDSVTAERLLRHLLKLVPEDMAGEMLPGERHQTLLQKLAARRKKITLLEETVPDDGGFIFRNPQIELNLTVRHLVRQLCLRHRAALAQHLFS